MLKRQAEKSAKIRLINLQINRIMVFCIRSLQLLLHVLFVDWQVPVELATNDVVTMLQF
jgi:hypothetical protein